MGGRVVQISSTAVKGLAMTLREAADVGPTGIVDDRIYALVDPEGRMVNGKRIGPLCTVVPEALHDPEALRLRFPDGTRVEAEAPLGGAVTTIFFGLERPAREVTGPFSAALSDWAGEPLRLVRLDWPNGGIDRANLRAAISIVSTASLADLSGSMGVDLDPRRFRMSIVVDGVPAYAEDGWMGRALRVGGAVVRPAGGIARCKVPGQDPDTGLPTHDVLGTLAVTRAHVESTEKSPFGIWAEVLEPGAVRVGDPVELVPGAG